jgi:hypothetical protein
VTQGTLKSLLLRPLPRTLLLLAKLLAVLLYPFVLLSVSFLGGLLAGLFHGLGPFYGGTGLGEGGSPARASSPPIGPSWSSSGPTSWPGRSSRPWPPWPSSTPPSSSPPRRGPWRRWPPSSSCASWWPSLPSPPSSSPPTWTST